MPKKPADDNSTKRLLIDPSGQTEMFEKSYQQELEDQKSKPVECLGRTFPNDAARREYYIQRLREHLKDPEFRKIEGFPNGEDEAILALSDPPYYTACPNPFLPDLIAQLATSRVPATEPDVQPLTRDVGHTRDTLVYSAHTYHTKVPPQAIQECIRHYTRPGDVILDVFCGSGMTGVASKMLPAVEARHTILCDLAPAATFVASTYMRPPQADAFEAASGRLLSSAVQNLRDLWTVTVDGKLRNVDFQVWTEVFSCPHCQSEIESMRVVDATEDIGSAKEFKCPSCQGLVSKQPTKASGASRLERRLKMRFDKVLGKPQGHIDRAPIHTEIAATTSSRTRIPTPDVHREYLESLDLDSEHWYPTNELIHGERYSWKDCLPTYGITHVHHFYLPRQLKTFAHLWHLASQWDAGALRNALLFMLTSNALGMTALNRFGPTHYSQVNKYFSGTLYVPSTVAEASPSYVYRNKRKRLVKCFRELSGHQASRHAISTQSATDLRQLPNACIDYVFVDPPFGRNLQYSELNQIWESWLRVRTARASEAVVDSTSKKGVGEYTSLMQRCFAELHRVLKPGRWMSVAFHNSSNAVWMGIQEAIIAAGFVIADVRTLDKKRQSYKQIRQGTVKQDLVITAYRPTESFERAFSLEAGSREGVWEFVRAHLTRLPRFVSTEATAEVVAERQDFLLFDRMVAFHIQRGLTVPMSAAEFYEGLSQRFAERDSMYFLPEQVSEYDRQRARVADLRPLELIPHDEASAIQWVRQQLRDRPRSFQELQPEFMRAVGGWVKHEAPIELLAILQQNFLCYDGQEEVPSQIHAYLSSNFKELRGKPKDDALLRAKAKDRWYVPDPKKSGDLEKLRERELLKEFEGYRTNKAKQIKVFRVEAMRAGFKAAYDKKDYQAIVELAEKLPEAVLQEDDKLLMYYDVAVMRAGDRKAKTELF
jgi:DNA modification methylase